MFINNWYAACLADELGTEPLRVRMLGCDFVLFRDAGGTPRCLSDVCCHRGASLSAGTCRAGTLICPQHGWEFSGAGRCTLIPAGTKTPTEPPKRARVPAYPTEEKYGLVFAFLGDLGEDERPAVPDIMPEYDTGDWHRGVISRKKDINYLRMAENYNDPCHVHYIHAFAKWLPKGVTIYNYELTDRYVKAFHSSWDDQGRHDETIGLLMEYDVISCVSRNTNYQRDYPPQIVTAYVTPIDAHNSQIHMILLMPRHEVDGRDGKTLRGATADEHGMLVNMTRDQVMDEDYAVLKTTRPRLAANPAEELLVETDVTIAQLRKLTTEYAAKFGEIDTKALAEIGDASVRVIPCPGHKSDPQGWVHKRAPLLAGRVRGKLQAAS